MYVFFYIMQVLKECHEPLGMGDGRIDDNQLSSNSVWNNQSDMVLEGRYYPGVVGKGWCANVPLPEYVWYQIKFPKAVKTTGLILDGI